MVWLMLFYTAWLVIVVSAGLWSVVCERWPIALAMAGGSFVGGSSPVAGGTIGFPLLVYVFNQPASLGRTFSLAIQSIGMVSASIYILTRRRTIEWRILRFALLGRRSRCRWGCAWWLRMSPIARSRSCFRSCTPASGSCSSSGRRGIVANEGSPRKRTSRRTPPSALSWAPSGDCLPR